MSADKAEILSREYGDARHLAVRVETHKLYSRSRTNFRDWVLSLVRLSRDDLVLDAGCGTGNFLVPLQGIVSSGVIGIDLSASVLADAAMNCRTNGIPDVLLVRGDVELMPFRNSTFDAVFANFVLQYSTGVHGMLRELSRILKKTGCLVVSTGSADSYREMKDIHRQVLMLEGFRSEKSRDVEHFCLENGAEKLHRFFQTVESDRFDDALVFDSAEPFMRYYSSGPICLGEDGKQNHALDKTVIEKRYDIVKSLVESEINSKGIFTVTKLDGVFIASQPICI